MRTPIMSYVVYTFSLTTLISILAGIFVVTTRSDNRLELRTAHS